MMRFLPDGAPVIVTGIEPFARPDYHYERRVRTSDIVVSSELSESRLAEVAERMGADPRFNDRERQIVLDSLAVGVEAPPRFEGNRRERRRQMAEWRRRSRG